MADDHPTSIRLDRQTKGLLDRAAKQRNQRVSLLIVYILRQWLKAQKLLSEK